MEIVITIALLLVPVLSIVALFLAIRCYTRTSALKQLVITMVQQGKTSYSPREQALKTFEISDM